MAQVDSFTRANNADLGEDWTPIPGLTGGAWSIVSGEAQYGTGFAQTSGEYFNSFVLPDDQYVQVTLGTVPPAGGAG